MTDTRKIFTATYCNNATNETYELASSYTPAIETALSRAWDLVGTAAQLNQWADADVTVIGVSSLDGLPNPGI